MRGGSRPNSGRKAILTWEERLYIGAECQVKFIAAAKEKQQAEIRRIFARSDYDAVIANVQMIPVNQRSAWLQSEQYETHCADVEEECHVIAGTDPEARTDDGDARPAPRIVSVAEQRPYGVRTKIISAVATDWSQRIGGNVSKSTVTRCWEELRSIMADLDESEGNKPIL